MIARLNAEHDAIVNSTYALEIAYREKDVDSARTACKDLGELLHTHTRRDENGLFPAALAHLDDPNGTPSNTELVTDPADDHSHPHEY